jgi:HPt (histidine-containing phosphotransfer) domain-containing protein
MSAALLDREVLDGLVEAVGADGARSVIELFIDESRRYVATIAAGADPAADAAARDAARRAAHSLKSGAGQIGAAAMAAAAEAVERAVEGSQPDLGAVAAALDGCTIRTVEVLSRIAAEL